MYVEVALPAAILCLYNGLDRESLSVNDIAIRRTAVRGGRGKDNLRGDDIGS